MFSLENLLKINTLAIAGTAAYFSIYGLAAIFASAFLSVVIMGIVLESGKLVAVSFLYQYWERIHFVLKTYLIAAIFALMVITSAGIFGYLTAAYQKDSIPLEEINETITLYQEQLAYNKGEVEKIDEDISRVSSNYITKRMELIDKYAPKKAKHETKIDQLTEDIQELKLKKIHTESHIGPIMYVGEMFDITPTEAIKYMVFLIMFVFDPLAIGLTLGINVIIKGKRKIELDDDIEVEDEPKPEPELENQPKTKLEEQSPRDEKQPLISFMPAVGRNAEGKGNTLSPLAKNVKPLTTKEELWTYYERLKQKATLTAAEQDDVKRLKKLLDI